MLGPLLSRTGDAYYKYGEALQKAILFYKANRLGKLPEDYILPYRAGAAMTDGQDVGLDLTGAGLMLAMASSLLIPCPMQPGSWDGQCTNIAKHLKKRIS